MAQKDPLTVNEILATTTEYIYPDSWLSVKLMTFNYTI